MAFSAIALTLSAISASFAGNMHSARESFDAALDDLPKAANHIGDISIHGGEIFAGVELFEDGEGKNIQIAIYDFRTLSYRRSVLWEPDSGQVEVSGVAVDPSNASIWLTD